MWKADPVPQNVLGRPFMSVTTPRLLRSVFAQPIIRRFSITTTQCDELPATPSSVKVIYSSSTPLLARIGGTLLTVKAAAAGIAAGLFGWREVDKINALLAASPSGTAEWQAFLSSTTLPFPVRARVHDAPLAVICVCNHYRIFESRLC